MSADTDTTTSAAADAAAAPLDLLLTDAAVGMLRRVNPGGSGLRLAAALVSRPQLVAGRGRQLLGELGRITVGTSQVQPSRRDRRFADPGWAGNPLLRRVMQAYLAAAESAEGVVADAGLDEKDAERVGFVVTNLIDALAPSNNPLLNPAAVKAAVDTGGGSALTGLRHFFADMAAPPRVPSMVEPDAFEVGKDLAVTPGSVILRTPELELIQYRPATATVRQVPLLIVPPVINKFYVMDLAPGRSMAEYLVGQGLQVFMISWRNPDARHAKWDLDTYGQAILDAMDATARITGSEQTVLAGACSGGIIAAMVAAHLAHTGQQDRLAAVTLMVTVLDQARAGLASAVIDERTAELAAAASRARGYLDGRSLAEVFAWLRPNDLIWNYWVNNYLLGRKPPPFDILFWNADTTRMTAGLHRDFLELGAANALVRPGAATMLGSPVDLAAVDRDSYIVAGITDHICPWQSCYRSTQLLGGRPRFLLSTSGHVAAMVNPPGNDKARYQMATKCPDDPQKWLRIAETCHGSWWPDYTGWLAERCGEERPRPRTWAAAGWRRSARRREPMSMTVDPPPPGPAGDERAGSGLGRVLGQLRRPGPQGPAERMRILTVGGRGIRVSVRPGAAGWPPLLLCNGIGVSLELFQPFVDALDPRRPVIRFDMPGIGGSPAPVVPYHLAMLPSLLAGLLDQLDYDQADVLGISWGGGLAQQFALSRPDRVRRLVLVATGPGSIMVPGHPRVLVRMLTPQRHRDPGYAAHVAGELYGGTARKDPVVARDLLHATTRLGPARGYYYQLISTLGWTSLPWLPKLRPPTLIMAGDDDPIIPVINARIMHRLIRRSRLHIYHGGHLELAADSERLAAEIEAFLVADLTAEASEQ